MHKEKFGYFSKALVFRLTVVVLLLFTSVSVVSATPARQTVEPTNTLPGVETPVPEDAIDSVAPEEAVQGANIAEDQANLGRNPHKHVQEMKRAPIERKGDGPQKQGELKPPEKDGPWKDESEEVAAHQLYLPLITQDGATTVQADVTAAAAPLKPVNLKVLVIAADGKETDYPAVTAFLSQIGIPYDTLLAAQTPLTANMLSNGTTLGYYQAVILVTGNLSYFNSSTNQWESAFDQTEWNTLWQYEATFGVRQLTSYTYPGGWPDNYGLTLVTYQDTTNAPLTATLTPAGQQIFSYLKPTAPITFRNTWVYLATVNNATTTTPLLTLGSYAIASINNYTDGRQNLAITAGNNPYLIHSLLLSYGAINWVTKGLFLGERHVYMGPQVDDLLIDSDMWDTTALTDTTGLSFRTSGADYQAVINWQNAMRTTYPLAAALKLEMAFNGEGASGIYSPDTLTPAVRKNHAPFNWVSHTYTHANLDTISYSAASTELSRNHTTATTQLRLTNYFRDALVQPDISGLYNSEFHRAAKTFGIKYLISDTSRPEWNNPTPNAGFYSTFQPSILIIPRRPTNLFYNLRTPAEWESEYNCFYGPNGTCAGGRFRYWSQNLTYEQILDKESDMWLQYLLKWDMDLLMFHQANLGAYNGTKSLLGDLIAATLAKYSTAYNLPIISLNQHNIGIKMANRMTYNGSGVRATWTPCQSVVVTTVKPALIPVTGLAYGTSKEVYGGQNISYIQMKANQSLTIAAPTCP